MASEGLLSKIKINAREMCTELSDFLILGFPKLY